jgi:hypothetical protein
MPEKWQKLLPAKGAMPEKHSKLLPAKYAMLV